MGSLAWRTFHGGFMSRQALPFTEDVIAFREPRQEEREEGRCRVRPGSPERSHTSPVFLPQPSLGDPSPEDGLLAELRGDDSEKRGWLPHTA